MQISDEMLADAVRAIPGVKMTNADGYNVSPADVMRAALSAILPAALAAERERCAGVVDQHASRKEDNAADESDPDYRERFLVYAKHLRRASEDIRALGDAP